MKKKLLLFLIFLFSVLSAGATDPKPVPIVVKSDNGWMKGDNDANPNNNVVESNDNFTVYTTSEGINLMLNNRINSVKLIALTGQILWSGELVQGRFFIPVSRGIYFLRINNKGYKVVCK